MKIKNIAVLLPNYNTPEQASGLRSSQVAAYLARRGYTVTAYAPGVDQRSMQAFPEMKGRLFAFYELEPGLTLIRTRTLSNFRLNPWRRLLYDVIYALLTIVRLLFTQKIDLIFVAYPPNIMPMAAVILAKLRGVPLILEFRDLVADALEESKYVKSSTFRRLAQSAEAFVTQQSDQIVVVSPGIKRILVQRGVEPDKVHVIPIGYAPEVFDKEQRDIPVREKFGWGDDFVVIYTGALTPAYDIPTLLRTAEKLREHRHIRFAIVGNGEIRAEYEIYSREHRLDKVQFIDYQPRKDLPAILEAADVGIHLFRNNPVWAYVLGNKAFDYLASGIPMVYAGTGATADLILEAKAGVVVAPEDSETLTDVLLLLVTQPELVRVMGENGRDHVLNHYDAWKLLTKLDQVIERACGTH
jgi:colanic acid biosynthesis glycosyl transferase WcaI